MTENQIKYATNESKLKFIELVKRNENNKVVSESGEKELVEDEGYYNDYITKHPSVTNYARALYPYTGTESGYLNIKKGDIILIESKDPSGWWKGKLGSEVGLFPGNHIELVCEDEIQQLNKEQPISDLSKETHNSNKLSSEMSEAEFLSQIEDLKNKVEEINPIIEELKDDVKALRKERKEHFQSYRNEMGLEEMGGDYYGINKVEELLYKVRFVMALLDSLVEAQEESKIYIDMTLHTLEEFSSEIKNQSQQHTGIKHYKKDLEKFILDYEAKLLFEQKNFEEDLSETQEKGNSFYDELLELQSVLINKLKISK